MHNVINTYVYMDIYTDSEKYKTLLHLEFQPSLECWEFPVASTGEPESCRLWYLEEREKDREKNISSPQINPEQAREV